MNDFSYHVGVLFVSLHVPAAQSLKQKRMVLKSIKDRVRNKFNVSVAELDGQDKWQVATLGFVMLGNDNRYIDSILSHILSSLEHNPEAEVCEHTVEFI